MKENPRGTSTPLKLSKLLATLLIDGDPDLFLLIVVKVTRVPRAFKLWYEGSFHLSLIDGNPVSRGKPLVVLDVIDPVLEVPKALGEIHLQKVPQQVLQVRAEVGWEPHLEGV